ncbi:hypothetical protein J6590_009551 [Homalodisca vitripennis]|nr:hypothetical protein J6590_009551 [Homalodisca vitripennis]
MEFEMRYINSVERLRSQVFCRSSSYFSCARVMFVQPHHHRHDGCAQGPRPRYRSSGEQVGNIVKPT